MMELGDLRSPTLGSPHTFIMVSEGRRVFSGPILTSHLGFYFGIFVVVVTCFAGLVLHAVRESAWKDPSKVGFVGRFRWWSLSLSGSLVESKAQRCRAFPQR